MQAKKAVVIAEKRYDVGKGTVLELNSSQVSLTQAQLTYNQSIYDYLVAKADLDRGSGEKNKDRQLKITSKEYEKKYPIGSPAVNCVYGLMYRWKKTKLLRNMWTQSLL